MPTLELGHLRLTMNVVNHPKVAVLRFTILALACVAYLCGQASNAQQQPTFQQPSANNPVQWLSGPTKVNLGDTAEIIVPDGYRFLDDKGSRYFLEGMHNLAPKNLVGILAPSSAKWFAVVKYSGIGYVKDTDASQLDAAGMLKTVQKLIARQNEASSKNGLTAIASADWELQPAYDPAQNKLEWAIRAVTGGNVATVNYSVRLLGRRGVLEVIAIQPYQADFDLAPLRDIVKGISFKDGERYTDYQAGDRLAKASMAQLAASENNPDSASASNTAKSSHKVLWIGIGLAGLLLVGVGILLVKNLLQGRRSPDSQKRPVAAAAVPRQPVLASQQQPDTAVAAPALPVRKSSQPVAFAKSQGPASQLRVSERNGKTPRQNGRKRKKQYNFHLFYSDMIMNLTRWNYLGGFGSYASDYAHGLNGSTPDQLADGSNHSLDNGHGTNGNHSNGTNGTNGNHNVSPTNGAGTTDAAKILAMETSKLIENQQKLIEGQRKLIDEQNKLIQEKSKLIDFEQTVLSKQSELIEEQELL